VSSQLIRALASLGIALTHSKPGQPAGRGKIERFFRTVREQFLVELAVPGALAAVDGLTGLNELFAGWVETVYHRRVHSETGQAPIERFLAPGPPVLPTPAALHEAFLWSQRRTVTKTATVSLHGNIYEVDAALVGRRVEVVFDPFDLTGVQIRFQGRPMGQGIAHRIGRHVHPGAGPEPAPAPAATGIDYLTLVHARHSAALDHGVRYAHLSEPQPDPGPASRADELAAELASFAALGHTPAQGQVPGQLELIAAAETADEQEQS